MEDAVTAKRKTCEELIDGELAKEMAEIKAALADVVSGANPQALREYGYGFSYVEPRESDNKEGFWQWVTSGGGPSSEFRLYDDESVSYVFMQWFDGASRALTGSNEATMRSLLQDMVELEGGRRRR
jgi:hypothetical protein